MFFDRYAAGAQLAQKLRPYTTKNTIVYALPKGGVPIGFEVARELNLPLDLVIVQKISHPISHHYGICAVAEGGEQVRDECGLYGLSEEWLRYEIKQKLNEADRRRELYKGGLPSVSAEDKVAIVVDDGIETGITMRAAVMSIQNQWPEKIIIASPVAAHDVVCELRSVADNVIVGLDDHQFKGKTSSYYVDYNPVTDMDVVALLADANRGFLESYEQQPHKLKSFLRA